METNSIMIMAISVFGMIILCTLFKISLLKIVKIILNSVFGGLLIFIINKIGISFGLHIGLNVITSIFIGVFGIPGAILLIAMKLF